MVLVPRSLRTKILLGFAVVVLLVTFVSVWTVTNIYDISHSATALIDGDFRTVDAGSQLRNELSGYNMSLIQYMANRGDSSRAAMTLHQEQVHHWIEEMRHSEADTAMATLLDTVGNRFRHLNVLVTQLVEIVASNRDASLSMPRALDFYSNKYLPVYQSIALGLRAQRDTDYHHSLAAIQLIDSSARFIGLSTMIIAAAMLILCIVASQKVLQLVLMPIRQLTASVERVAAGDFQHDIAENESEDELSGLVRAFNRMTRRLSAYDAMKLGEIVAEKRRCETIVRDLTDVVVATDEQFRVIYFNRRAEDVFGLPARMAIGGALSDLARARPLMLKLREDIGAGRFDGPEEMVTSMAGGAELTYNYEAQSIRNETGDILGYVLHLKDVTRFRQLDEIKTKMVSTVSHELRTPLTSIGMGLELMLEEDMRAGMEPLQLELLQNIQEDVRRLQSFCNDLLDLSRLESGRMRLNLAPIAPRNLAENAVRNIIPLARRQEIQIDTTGIPLTLPDVLCDSDRVAQVFNNLFSNAIRYTPLRGTIAVTATLGNGAIEFRVRDNGPGIAPGDALHVFEKFYQVRDDQRAGGSGLGLAIVKEIIDAHGGTVWVESAAGQGSSFTFTLPVSPVSLEGPGDMPVNRRLGESS
ncbi:MAG: ATP-binding protein [Candidatus Kapaibacterium sp.]